MPAVTPRTLRGKVAVAGIGESTYYKRGEAKEPEFVLGLRAILAACADAGIDPRDVEARQRLAALTLEPGDPPIVAGEDLGQTARPRAVERVLERARERRPDLGGRGARGDLVRVEERDRRRIAGQAASTTTVAP